MSVQEKPKNIKYLREAVDASLVVGLLVLAFLLGKASALLSVVHPIQVIRAADFALPPTGEGSVQAESSQKTIVASRNGTKYYYPWCSGVGRIKEENKVWFGNVAEAEGAGYTKAANCPGN